MGKTGNERVFGLCMQVAELLVGVPAPILYWEQGHEWLFGDPVRFQVMLPSPSRLSESPRSDHHTHNTLKLVAQPRYRGVAPRCAGCCRTTPLAVALDTCATHIFRDFVGCWKKAPNIIDFYCWELCARSQRSAQNMLGTVPSILSQALQPSNIFLQPPM